MSDSGAMVILGLLFLAVAFGVIALTGNVSVSYTDVHQAIQLCQQNGGLDNIAEDRGNERVITCANGAVYTYSHRDWDAAFGDKK